MEHPSCLREFIRYIMLNVLGMIGLSCYILADTFFIAKGLGSNGLAALNLAIPVYSFVHGTGLMLGVGGATRYAVLCGQKAHNDADRIFTNIIYAAAAFAGVYMLAGILLSEEITILLGADDNVFAMTNTYLRVILLFSPAFLLNDILVCFIRNDGNPRLSMAAMLTGSLSNIVLDYIFIFPLSLGILGAVLATGLAPVIGILVLSFHLRRRIRFHFKCIKPLPGLIGRCFMLGIPSLISEVASGIVIIVFNMLILGLRGNVGVAAYGVVANISLVVISIYTGVAQGMQPLVSRFYGYGDSKSNRHILRYAVRTVLAASVILYLGIFAFTDSIVRVFNSENNEQLQIMAREGMRMYFLAVPFVGFNIILSMFFTATEKSLPAQAISLLRGILLIIPVAFFMSFLAGVRGVWLALTVTEGLVAVLGVLFYCKYIAFLE